MPIDSKLLLRLPISYASHLNVLIIPPPPFCCKHLNFRIFCFFYNISTKAKYINKELHDHIMTLRAISNLFSFIIHPV